MQGYALNLEATASRQDKAEEYGIDLGVKVEF